MGSVPCPKCAAAIANDGSLVGKPVVCSKCGVKFTMPPLPLAVIQQDVVPVKIRTTPQVIHLPSGRPGASWILVLSIACFVACVAVLLTAMVMRPTSANQQSSELASKPVQNAGQQSSREKRWQQELIAQRQKLLELEKRLDQREMQLNERCSNSGTGRNLSFTRTKSR
jgi:hypothetical protein